MDKEESARVFWTALGVIGIGGIALYYQGVRPEPGLSSEVIPVEEPTLIDWVEVGGILYFI